MTWLLTGTLPRSPVHVMGRAMTAQLTSKEPLPEGPALCPLAETITMLSGKWKPMILHLLAERPYRFGELHRELNQVSKKVLTQQLRDLEHDGLLERTVHATIPPRVDYGLSLAGNALTPILNSMYSWGAERRRGKFTRGQ